MPLPATALHASQPEAALPAFPNGSVNAGTLTLIFRIRDKQTFQLLKEHKLLLMPEHFTQETEARTSLYYTQGNIVADVPLASGIGATIFTITGHTGFRGVLAQGGSLRDRLAFPGSVDGFVDTVRAVGASIGQVTPAAESLVDGAAAIQDLENIIRAYFFPGGHSATRGVVSRTQDLQLEFLNATAPTSSHDYVGRVGWIIHPHRNLVSIQQSKTKPWLYFYTLTFAGIGPLAEAVVDVFAHTQSTPETLRTALAKLTKSIQSVTNGVNTIRDGFEQLLIQNVTGPVSSFLLSGAQLADAVQDFLNGVTDTIRWPLYAQRLITDILDAPAHSVDTLGKAAVLLGEVLVETSLASLKSLPGVGTLLTGGTNDELTMQVNHETPFTFAMGSQTTGPAIAAAIQSAVRSQTPGYAANRTAYTEFVATYDASAGQYLMQGGTHQSDMAQVHVVPHMDSDLFPRDAAAVLGLGQVNGGQEHAGTSKAAVAIALLRGVEEACTQLQSFPDYFATQLAEQDRQLAQRQPGRVVRTHIRGNQRLVPVPITPGDSLQAIAARVGVPWETLAMVNNLTYPYLVMEPATLTTGRMSSADQWSFSDTHVSVSGNAYQGQRVDILSGAGAGQSRVILRNTATLYQVDRGWSSLPNDTSDYAIRSAANPILQTGTVTSCTTQSLTDSALHLVPDSQVGLTLWIATGPEAGERRRIVAHDATTYSVHEAWDVLPAVGSIYLILVSARTAGLQQKLLGDTLNVPRPSGEGANPAIRSRLVDVTGVTGRPLSQTEKLFGCDFYLDPHVRSVVWNPVTHDAVTIAGLANLRQAVIHLVNLPLGQLEYAPGLGSYVQEELGSTARMATQTQLLHSVERTIRQDARIASLGGVTVFTQGGRTFLSVSATATSGDMVERVTIR